MNMMDAINKVAVVCVLCGALSTIAPAAALARGGTGSHSGMGMHHSAVTGGALGTSAAAPGTNSAGTALSAGGSAAAMKGPMLGTGDPAVDREDANVDRMVKSICRGC